MRSLAKALPPGSSRHLIQALRILGLMIAFMFADGCMAQPLPASAVQEESSMGKSSSRIPAPTVAPVTIGKVRYEQVRNGLLAGFDQMGGYLVAYDAESGKQLWTLKVYDNKRLSDKEGDVQDVFFKSMTVRPDGTLLIENERDGCFVVDPVARSVRVGK
jgi:hypothetical protein